MKKIDTTQLDFLVGTQYNDLRGIAAIDFNNSIQEFYSFIIDHNVDLTNKFIVGFDVYLQPHLMIDMDDLEINIYIYYVKNEDNKVFDELKYIENKEVFKMDFKANLIEFLRIIKRLNISMVSNMKNLDFSHLTPQN